MRALPPPPLPSRTAWLLLGGLVVVWGLHWPIVKAVLGELPPMTYAALRVATAIPAVLLVLGARREIELPPRGDLPVLVVVGLGQIAIGTAIMNLALLVVPAGRSSVLSYTTPLWTALLGAALLGLRLRRREGLGVAVGVVGMGLLFAAGLDGGAAAGGSPSAAGADAAGGPSGLVVGSLALVAGAVVNAGAVLVLRAHRWRSTPLRLQPWELAIGLVPLAILAAILEDPATIDLTPTLLLAVLYSGPLATAFAFWAYQTIARTLTPSQTTTGLLAVPVVGLASSALLLGEPLGPGDIAGFATTLAGIALVAGPGRGREP